jgi:uncharacterized protein YndB with AHSA1/START domain
MEDRFEATFVVEVERAEVWEALVQDDRTEPGGPQRLWLPAFPNGTGEVLELEPERLLRVRKDQFPCEGTEIAITLESTDRGTRVTVVQSGFGAAFEAMLNLLALGWSQIVADLIVFCGRGVVAGRHELPWRDIGFQVRPADGGVEVIGKAAAGSFGEQAGLCEGDLVLAISSAPIIDLQDFTAVARALPPGSKVEVTWLRGRDRMSGSGVV